MQWCLAIFNFVLALVFVALALMQVLSLGFSEQSASTKQQQEDRFSRRVLGSVFCILSINALLCGLYLLS